MKEDKMKIFTPIATNISANQIRAIITIIVLPFFIFSCSPTKTAIKPLQFRIVETTLSKGIYDKGTYAVPQNPTTQFSTDDTEIISYIRLENLSGAHHIRWDWYKPDGTLYSSTENYPIGTKKGKYREELSTWHTMLIKGHKAEKYANLFGLKVRNGMRGMGKQSGFPIKMLKRFKRRALHAHRQYIVVAESGYFTMGLKRRIITGILTFSTT
jgi:hypothetical protein